MIDWSRSLGCGGFKELPRFRQSRLFSFSIKKKTNGGSAHGMTVQGLNCYERRESKKIERKNCRHALTFSRKHHHHFTLFCGGRQRNVPKCKTHVQAIFFLLINPNVFSDVLVTSKFPNISSNFVRGVPIIYMKYMKFRKQS